jgi:glycine/D-amino acid oxidase-like deaminating enzyme
VVLGKVIIVGGSVGGVSAGVLLHRAGWQVMVYERSALGLGGKGAGLVPQPDVSRILAEIGREDVLETGVVARERIILDRQGRIVQTLRTPQSQMSWDLLFEAFRSELPENCYRRGVRVLSASCTDDTAAVTMRGANHVNRAPETFIEFVAKVVERVVKRTSYLCATSRNIDMIDGRELRKKLSNRCGAVDVSYADF